MNTFHIKTGDFVLLIGEGNFTFSHSLIKCMKNSDNNTFENFFVTCLEKAHESLITEETKTYLEQSGVHLIFDVNATKLSKHLILGKLVFNKIIFNFPHVGGKMKIHLNRQLLQDFFLESSSLLANEGEIIVSLCAGQGGTFAERVHRRWDDTWQVVEMAARNDLILKETEYFPHEIFSSYISIGYRGKRKSFNTNNSIIHYFCKGLPLLINLNEFVNLHAFDGVLMSYAHQKKLTANPLMCSNTPQSYLVKILEDVCFTFDCEYLRKSNVPLYTKCPESSNQAECVVSDQVFYLRKTLLHVAFDKNCDMHYIVKGLSFNKIADDFTVAPAECHIAVFGPLRKEICSDFVRKVENLFYFHNQSRSENKTAISFENSRLSQFIIEDKALSGININIDQILVHTLNTNWQQLWSSGTQLLISNEYPSIITKSIHSQSFIFDISFRPTEGPLDVKKLVTTVAEMNCEFIQSVCLLNVYSPNDNKEIHCFRFVYKSYSSALCRRKALVYHNLIGKAIEQLMHVVIV